MSDSVLRILYLVLKTINEDTEVQRGEGTYPELYGWLRGRTGIQAADIYKNSLAMLILTNS